MMRVKDQVNTVEKESMTASGGNFIESFLNR